jgi:hypothetical protein
MQKRKKLQLNAQTVRLLAGSHLREVNGGASDQCAFPTVGCLTQGTGDRCTKGFTGCQNQTQTNVPTNNTNNG